MFKKINKILNPSIYQGHGKKKNYFEGWYYKIVDKDEQNIYAIIPGIFWSQDSSKSHAFIQILNGKELISYYVTFSFQEFWAAKDKFEVRIGDNYFSTDRLSLNILDNQITLNGSLLFKGISPWPVTPISPGAMGWYRYVPFMECYHGVVSLDHCIKGSLIINHKKIDFSNGRGYIEKDWGQAFPKAWIWCQCNHFAKSPGTSITISVATIPWLRSSFQGFIIGLWHKKKLYRFATYTGAKLTVLKDTKSKVYLEVKDKKMKLEIEIIKGACGSLKSPERLEMRERVLESITSQIRIKLSDLNTKDEIFNDVGRCAGLEVCGTLIPI